MRPEDMIKRYTFADIAGEYLSHHGIKGQRWYHRRFQNPDGSLTPAGRERYGHIEGNRLYVKKDNSLTVLGKMRYNLEDSRNVDKGVKLSNDVAIRQQIRKAAVNSWLKDRDEAMAIGEKIKELREKQRKDSEALAKLKDDDYKEHERLTQSISESKKEHDKYIAAVEKIAERMKTAQDMIDRLDEQNKEDTALIRELADDTKYIRKRTGNWHDEW